MKNCFSILIIKKCILYIIKCTSNMFVIVLLFYSFQRNYSNLITDLHIFKLILNFRLIYNLLILLSVYVQKYFLVIDVIRLS